MLRVIEFGLLGVSLLVVIGLIVTGRQNGPEPSESEPAVTRGPSDAREPGKLPE